MQSTRPNTNQLDKLDVVSDASYHYLGCLENSPGLVSLEGTDPVLEDPPRERSSGVNKCFLVSQCRGFSAFALGVGGECFSMVGDNALSDDDVEDNNQCFAGDNNYDVFSIENSKFYHY